MFSLVPFIVVHTNAALNDLLELWDFDLVETVRFNSLRKTIRRVLFHLWGWQRWCFK